MSLVSPALAGGFFTTGATWANGEYQMEQDFRAINDAVVLVRRLLANPYISQDS